MANLGQLLPDVLSRIVETLRDKEKVRLRLVSRSFDTLFRPLVQTLSI